MLPMETRDTALALTAMPCASLSHRWRCILSNVFSFADRAKTKHCLNRAATIGKNRCLLPQ